MGITILLIVAGLIAALLVYASRQPDRFSVQRRISIDAPPENIFPLINEFQQWGHWSPWATIDPSMQQSFSGPSRGEGAIYKWSGNNKVGSGRMEIIESVPSSLIRIQLDFTRPFEAHNISEFALAPDGNATTVTWTMSGPANFLTKLMSVFVSMDRMVGKDFERGLSGLKTAAMR
jgi:hypothetical protein